MLYDKFWSLFEEGRMKKKIALVALVVSNIVLTSCNETSTSINTTSSDISSSSPTSTYDFSNVSVPQGNGEKLFAKSLFCDDIDNVNGSIKVYYDENCNYLYDEDVIAPFNTSMKVILAYTSSQKDMIDSKAYYVQNRFTYNIQHYHALFDRHYFYKENGVKINNLAVVNASYGSNKKVKIEKELFDALKDSVEMTKYSDGLFNMTIGDLSDLWNDQITLAEYKSFTDDEYRELSKNAKKVIYIDPLKDDVDKAKSTVLSYEELKESLVFDEENLTVTFKEVERLKGTELRPSITLGGFAKGKATELFYQSGVLDSLVSYIDSGSSSIKFLGNRADEKPWTVNLTNPKYMEVYNSPSWESSSLLNGSEVQFFLFNDFSISSSGYYNHYFYAKDASMRRRNHIINPLTGYSENFFDAVTIVMDDAGLADMYTTALMSTTSIEEADALLAKMNEGFNTSAKAIYMNYDEKTSRANCYIDSSFLGNVKYIEGLSNPVITDIHVR